MKKFIWDFFSLDRTLTIVKCNSRPSLLVINKSLSDNP